jgi:HAE1 family hydrophobic/amphiphilic exporter-1
VVNNPILIVEQSLVHWRDDGLPIGQAVIESVRTRIRPIFMTTLGGLVGLLPLVLAPGAGSELYRGIGAVLLGGLLISTMVTLVFVPALLSLMMELRTYLAERMWPTPVVLVERPGNRLIAEEEELPVG